MTTPPNRAEMSPAKTFALIIAILVVGPVMYIVARGLSLARGFEKVQVGDTSAAVIAVLGQPQEQAGSGSDTEYRYSTWPVPETWVVSFKDGKVVGKITR